MMRGRPQYLHNDTQAFLTVEGGRNGLGLESKTDLVYNGCMDVIWHEPTAQTVHRRYLLTAFREHLRGRTEDPFIPTGYATTIWVGAACLRVAECREILAICADMRRHIPTKRRWR